MTTFQTSLPTCNRRATRGTEDKLYARSWAKTARYLPAIGGLPRTTIPIDFTQLFLFNSRIIVETDLPRLTAIQLGLNPQVNYVSIKLLSSIPNCLYFSIKYFLPKNVALQFGALHA
jgi:hypothetical protein